MFVTAPTFLLIIITSFGIGMFTAVVLRVLTK